MKVQAFQDSEGHLHLTKEKYLYAERHYRLKNSKIFGNTNFPFNIKDKEILKFIADNFEDLYDLFIHIKAKEETGTLI